jgi:hypothetical protein
VGNAHRIRKRTVAGPVPRDWGFFEQPIVTPIERSEQG